jgi:hypothetical protein
MKAIIDTDPDETEVEDRTISYFVDSYKARFAVGYQGKNFFHRLIFDPDDPDVDSDGNTTEKRHLRPVHRAEVLGIFASQAEWILRDQLDRKEKNFLNVKNWYQFCQQAMTGRREAKKNEKRWGRAYGEDSDADDSDDGDQIDFGRAGVSGDDLDKYKRTLQRKLQKKPKRKSRAKDKGKQVSFLLGFCMLASAKLFEFRRLYQLLFRKKKRERTLCYSPILTTPISQLPPAHPLLPLRMTILSRRIQKSPPSFLLNFGIRHKHPG